MSMSEENLKRDLTIFKQEETVLPADICQALLQRRADYACTSRDWDEYLACMLPFEDQDDSTKQFDPFAPSMKALPRLPGWRFQAFSHSFLEKLLMPLLLDGEASMATARTIAQHCLKAMGKVDEMMMEPTSGAFAMDLQTVMHGLLVIIEMPFASLHSDAVEALASPRTARKGPLQTVSGVLAQSNFYQGRIAKFTDALPIITEKEDIMSEHIEFLETWAEKVDTEGARLDSERLIVVYDDMGRILQKVPQVTMAFVLNTLLDVSVKHVNHCIDMLAKSVQTSDFVQALSKLASMASLVFTLDVRVAQWPLKIHEMQMTAQREVIMKAFMEMISKFATCDINNDALNDIVVQSGRCNGMDLPAATMNDIERALSAIAKSIIMKPAELNIDLIWSAFASCLHFLTDGSGWHSIHSRLQAAQHLAGFNLDFDEGIDSIDSETLKQFRKALVDARQERVVAAEGGLADVAPELVDIVNKHFTEILDDIDRKHETATAKELSCAQEKFNIAKEALVKVAYGGDVPGQAWSKGLKATANLTTVTTMAKQKGLLDLDIAALKNSIDDYTTAWDRFTLAADMASVKISEPEVEITTGLKQRAALTSAEVSLLRLTTETLDPDRLRKSVQSIIRDLRGVGLREKDCLPSSLYRWAFGAITER